MFDRIYLIISRLLDDLANLSGQHLLQAEGHLKADVTQLSIKRTVTSFQVNVSYRKYTHKTQNPMLTVATYTNDTDLKLEFDQG